MTEAATKSRDVYDVSAVRAGGIASRSLFASILPRIEFAFAGHGDGERPQRVQDLHGAGMLRQHVRQAPIGHRAFVEVGTDQGDAALVQPAVHLVATEASLRLLASEQAAGA